MEPSCLYVSVSGDDANPGTKEKPFRSLEVALRQLKSRRTEHVGTLTLFVADGTHFLQEPLVITPDLGGQSGAPTIICAEEQAAPVISGGIRLQVAWKPYNDRLFVAEIPAGLSFTELYVDGARACLARYPNYAEEEVLGGFAADCLSPERVGRWSNPVGGFVHGLSHHRWGSVHYRITGVDPEGQCLLSGGDQINRESRLHEQYRFVENIFEELDHPNEWYLDREAGLLYYYPPAGINVHDATFIAANQQQLLEVKGSMTDPVRHVHLSGLTFAHTARTILEPYEPLLRGDWSIVRKAAVLMEGTEDCNVTNCRFEALGGNAYFLNRYNRRNRFADNLIRHCGDSGVAIVGDLSAVRGPVSWKNGDRPLDLEPGPANADYPSHSTIENNLIHHIGESGKQTAGVFLSMAEHIAVRHNTIFHVPRAAICINDGCWGGHRIEYNDLFDTVRETNDHGPINGWGRDRHWNVAPEAHANPRLLSRLDPHQKTVINNNRFREIHSSFGIDLDDGCSHYTVTRNLCIGTGIKLREGYERNVTNNILFGRPFRKGVCYADNGDVIARNIVVRLHESDVWNSAMGSPGEAARIDEQLYYVYDGSEPVFCFRSPREAGIKPTMTWTEWQARGHDLHSLVEDPRFIDPEQLDFRLHDDSPAFCLGFEPFKTEGFGVFDAAQYPDLQAALASFLPALARTLFTRQQAANSLYTFVVRTNESLDWRGVTLKNVLGEDEVTFTGLAKETGIMVTALQPACPSFCSDLQMGDVILGVNGKPIDTVKEFKAATEKTGPLSFDVLRNQKQVKLMPDPII
ncbi:PDZ domain-containing protein [Paenibacillus cymbidii]|uniref:PDZ domain-containing protein n=1 Tax=Paenibacillus cymbidii TaxID=1639034 RepID=UPI00107FF477|nr:PDZ domain-containing protein [Paenibacillus cymbidii]